MNGNWIALHTVPRAGKTFVFNDQGIWRGPLKEFGVSCTILKDITAEIFVLPLDEGVLFRGKITGSIALPCDRCADDARVDIEHAFDDFEPYPAGANLLPTADAKESVPRQRTAQRKGGRKSAGGKDAEVFTADLTIDADEAVIRTAPRGPGVEINPAALAWEEFSLALPIKPLCRENCLGLCPICGKNRNLESCSCDTDGTDPRLSVLRALKAKA
ncbi:MAG: DUF177 domain-containing protein [Desulfovibrio sp.]|jgi:uncharacterized protein|nr:DUF177 domain-containing protein [Desulfovibrio sp.]